MPPKAGNKSDAGSLSDDPRQDHQLYRRDCRCRDIRDFFHSLFRLANRFARRPSHVWCRLAHGCNPVWRLAKKPKMKPMRVLPLFAWARARGECRNDLTAAKLHEVQKSPARARGRAVVRRRREEKRPGSPTKPPVGTFGSPVGHRTFWAHIQTADGGTVTLRSSQKRCYNTGRPGRTNRGSSNGGGHDNVRSCFEDCGTQP